MFFSQILNYFTHIRCKQFFLCIGILIFSIPTGFLVAVSAPGSLSTTSLHSSSTNRTFSQSSLVSLASNSASATSQVSLAFSTFLGGTSYDQSNHIAVDRFGNIFITGSTSSSNFPTLHAYQPTFGDGSLDVFVSKFSASGQLLFSTFLGGSGFQSGTGIAVDSFDNCYITGYTDSLNFPTLHAYNATYGGGSFDAFVAKFDATGNLVFSTYLGGSNYDGGNNIGVDSSGNSYVTGYTYSPNFPTLHAYNATFGGGSDVFVSKLNSAGQLEFSTFLGSAGNDSGQDIAVDSAGDSFVTGSTTSSDFPTLNAFNSTFGGKSDAFVSKFDTTGKLVFSTFLGGRDIDVGSGIAVDSSGNSYVTGYTYSTDFPTLRPYDGTYGMFDAFVSKFTSSGQLVFSTFLDPECTGTSIAVDSTGNSYVTGYTYSPNFPTLHAYNATYSGGADVFVAKFNATDQLIFSTFLGGSISDLGSGIAVDGSGNSYITGFTNSPNFPTFNAYNATYSGCRAGCFDAFVSKFNAFPSSSSSREIFNVNNSILISFFLVLGFIAIGNYLVIEKRKFSTSQAKNSSIPTQSFQKFSNKEISIQKNVNRSFQFAKLNIQNNESANSTRLKSDPRNVKFLFPFLAFIGLLREAIAHFNKTETLEHPVRNQIIHILEETKFEHLNSLKAKIQCRMTTLLWHLNQLEKYGFIGKEKYEQYTIIYLNKEKPIIQELEVYVALQSSRALKILDFIIGNSPTNLEIVSRSLVMRPSVIKGILTRFIDSEVLVYDSTSGNVYLINMWLDVLKKSLARMKKELRTVN